MVDNRRWITQKTLCAFICIFTLRSKSRGETTELTGVVTQERCYEYKTHDGRSENCEIE